MANEAFFLKSASAFADVFSFSGSVATSGQRRTERGGTKFQHLSL